MPFRVLRVFIGLFILMIPAAMAHRTMMHRGYDNTHTHGYRATRFGNEPYPEYFSKEWKAKVVTVEIKAQDKKAKEIESRLAELSAELVKGSTAPAGPAAPGVAAAPAAPAAAKPIVP